MNEKSKQLKSILNAIAIALVVPLFILASQTSSLAVQPQVAAAGSHTVGVKSDGTVVAVGGNSKGQINVVSWRDIVQVAASYYHTVGVKSDGTVVAVGDNDYSQCNFFDWDLQPDFGDVPSGYWAEYAIYKIFNAGITTGYFKKPLKYCPENNVTRAQMAVFLGRGIHSSSFTPPPATGIFDDVSVSYWAADWIEQLYREGITTGCQKNPLRYCPDSSVTRAQMAVFIVRTFGL